MLIIVDFANIIKELIFHNILIQIIVIFIIYIYIYIKKKSALLNINNRMPNYNNKL